MVSIVVRSRNLNLESSNLRLNFLGFLSPRKKHLGCSSIRNPENNTDCHKRKLLTLKIRNTSYKGHTIRNDKYLVLLTIMQVEERGGKVQTGRENFGLETWGNGHAFRNVVVNFQWEDAIRRKRFDKCILLEGDIT